MKIIFMRRPGWIIAFAACIFIVGNIILLYKFMGKPSSDFKASMKMNEFIRQHLPKAVPSSKVHLLASLLRQVQKQEGAFKSGTELPYSTLEHGSKEDDARKKNQDFFQHTKTAIESKETRAEPKIEIQLRRDIERNEIRSEANENNAHGEMKLHKNNHVVAVLVIACNRPTVRRCLDQLLKYRPSENQFPIIVSQDCGHAETAAVIRSYGSKVTLMEQPNLSEVSGVPVNMRRFMGYYKISRHYKWALGQVFDKLGYESVIVVEDDLDIGEICVQRVYHQIVVACEYSRLMSGAF